MKIPKADMPLSADEEAELNPIVTALTIAAVESERLADGVLVATMKRIAATPDLLSAGELSAEAIARLAAHYRRADEKVGTFVMDIVGTHDISVPYIFGSPTDENVAGAAERALNDLKENRSLGRSPHPAHEVLAHRLGVILRASGGQIARRRRKVVRRKHGTEFQTYDETGPFHEFLEVVLDPLRAFLHERRLPPVTTESIVRIAMKVPGARRTQFLPQQPSRS